MKSYHPTVDTKKPAEASLATANVILVNPLSTPEDIPMSLEPDGSSNVIIEENSLTGKRGMVRNDFLIDNIKTRPQTPPDPFYQEMCSENESPELKKIRTETEAAVRSLKTNLILVGLLLVFNFTKRLCSIKLDRFTAENDLPSL